MKISDYGISRYATVGGLKIDAGTVGSKAPEQLKARSTDTPYDEKVDVYSYGLLLFYLLTNGHNPFEEFTGAFEKEKAFEEVCNPVSIRTWHPKQTIIFLLSPSRC